jgi:hypothetical protein
MWERKAVAKFETLSPHLTEARKTTQSPFRKSAIGRVFIQDHPFLHAAGGTAKAIRDMSAIIDDKNVLTRQACSLNHSVTYTE